MRRRLAQVLTTMALAMFVVAPPALAGGDNGGDDGDHDGKKRKCVKHFTGSETNPYNFLWLPRNAALNHVAQHGDIIVGGVDSRAECKALDDTPR
jgi:hypothetical protein